MVVTRLALIAAFVASLASSAFAQMVPQSFDLVPILPNDAFGAWDANMANGSTTLTSVSRSCVLSRDNGKPIQVLVPGVTLNTTIAGCSGSAFTLAAPAGADAVNVQWSYGTDASPALTAADAWQGNVLIAGPNFLKTNVAGASGTVWQYLPGAQLWGPGKLTGNVNASLSEGIVVGGGFFTALTKDNPNNPGNVGFTYGCSITGVRTHHDENDCVRIQVEQHINSTYDPSNACPTGSGFICTDGVGLMIDAEIKDVLCATCRVWSINPLVHVATGADGYAANGEFDIQNDSSDQPFLSTTTTKIGPRVVSLGLNPSTGGWGCSSSNGATNGFHLCFWTFDTAIAPGGSAYAVVHNPGPSQTLPFNVDASGNVTSPQYNLTDGTNSYRWDIDANHLAHLEIPTAGAAAGAIVPMLILNQTKTANYTVNKNLDNNSTINNRGATTPITVTLGVSTIGLRYCFAIMAAQTMTIAVPAGTVIHVGSSVVSASGGTIPNATVGETLCLQGMGVSTDYYATSLVGTHWVTP